jgi:hypothetical protein
MTIRVSDSITEVIVTEFYTLRSWRLCVKFLSDDLFLPLTQNKCSSILI